MPASYSAPMDPFLKRVSGVAVTQSGCGSSRKNLYQPTNPTRPATTRSSSTMALMTPNFRRLDLTVTSVPDRLDSAYRMNGPACGLEGLEKLDQRSLLARRQLGAVTLAFMALVRIPRHIGLEFEIRAAVVFRRLGHEADALAVVEVVAAIKNLGTAAGGLKQIPQGRDGAVVKIRRAQPEPVER